MMRIMYKERLLWSALCTGASPSYDCIKLLRMKVDFGCFSINIIFNESKLFMLNLVAILFSDIAKYLFDTLATEDGE